MTLRKVCENPEEKETNGIVPFPLLGLERESPSLLTLVLLVTSAGVYS